MSVLSDERLKESFLQLGFDTMSRYIYLWLIENGPAKARLLSISLNQPKTTILEKLYALEKNGLVGKQKIKNSYEFYPESPQKISSLLARKEKELEYVRNKSINEINELEKRFSPASIPIIEFYEGKENIKKQYQKSLKSQTDLFTFGDVESEARYLGNFAHDYWNLKSTARITSFSLTLNNTKNIAFTTLNDAKHLRKSYYYNTKEDIPMSLFIYDASVNFVSTIEEIGISIESEELARTLKSILSLLNIVNDNKSL